MIDRTHALKVGPQCELLDLQRSTFYYQPKADHSKSLELMRKIDALHLDFPWMGSRSIRDQLARDGLNVCRDRIRGLMRRCVFTRSIGPPERVFPLKVIRFILICSKIL
jgi:putative transposase